MDRIHAKYTDMESKELDIKREDVQVKNYKDDFMDNFKFSIVFGVSGTSSLT